MSNGKAVEAPPPPLPRSNVQSIGAGLRPRDPLAMIKPGSPARPPAVEGTPASKMEGGKSPSAPLDAAAGQEQELAAGGQQVAAPTATEVTESNLGGLQRLFHPAGSRM